MGIIGLFRGSHVRYEVYVYLLLASELTSRNYLRVTTGRIAFGNIFIFPVQYSEQQNHFRW